MCHKIGIELQKFATHEVSGGNLDLALREMIRMYPEDYINLKGSNDGIFSFDIYHII